jgi:hypothetical protein
MKIAVLLSLARQVEGEFVFADVVKAHENPEKLHRYLRETNLPQTTTIGGVHCTVEYGVIENIIVEQDSPPPQ